MKLLYTFLRPLWSKEAEVLASALQHVEEGTMETNTEFLTSYLFIALK